MSARLKYTDRDVRENDDLTDLVIDYLHHYEGEFDFLVDCKMRAASNRDLTIGMVRGVLNCMRNDPRLPYELPEPMPPEEGNVVSIKKIRPRKKKFVPYHERPECPLFLAGLAHTHKIWKAEWEYQNCSGLYHINRPSSYRLPAVVKYPFLVARGGKMVHKADGEGYVTWYTNAHEYGFYKYLNPQLSVKIVCKYPRWIDKPILLLSPKATDLGGDTIPLCVRCFPKGEQ